jgi:ankyrin repeat protein
VKLLIKSGCDIDTPSKVSHFVFKLQYIPLKTLMYKDGSTALHKAVYLGHFEIVRSLIKSGCNVHARTNVSYG